MTESRLIARAYPLEVRAVGFVGGRLLVARSNYDIVEVRDEHGTLVMRHVVALEGEPLLGQLAFVGGRFLVVELVVYIFPQGARAWDFEEGRWCPSILEHGPDVALVGLCEPDVFLAREHGVDRADVARGVIASRQGLPGVWSASACAESPGLVAFGGDAHMIGYVDVERPGAIVTMRDEDRIASRPVEGWEPPVAWRDRATLLFGVRSRVMATDPSLQGDREIVDLGARVYQLVVLSKRWLRAVTDADDVLIELPSGRVFDRREAIVCVSPDEFHACWADRDGVQRVPLSDG